MGLYDRYLALRVRASEGSPPENIALVITERDLLEPGAYDTLSEFLEWAFAYGAEHVTIYVSVLDPEAVAPLRRGLESVDAPRAVAVHGPDDEMTDAEGADDGAPIQVSVGLGGKHEFTEAVRSLAEEAAAGELDPAELDEAHVESELVFTVEPDLVIKTGAERLSDFMIWQSVYSELYFTDVNWRDFRKRDYLRAIREYTDRSRRFGR